MMESELLKWGGLGFAAIVVVLLLRPLVMAVVKELCAGREERTEMREQFMGFIQNHAAEQTEALHHVKEGLGEVAATLRGLNGRDKESG